jgi:hypothetical protein
MHFEGDLSAIDASTVFQVFDMSALTGALKFIKPRATATFYFRKGQLIYADMDNKQKIGEVLVDKRLITQKQLRGALHAYRHEKGYERLGAILVARGYIDQDVLIETIQEQMREIVYKTLSWKKGYFVFFKGIEPLREDIFLEVNLHNLILEGLSREDHKGEKPELAAVR